MHLLANRYRCHSEDINLISNEKILLPRSDSISSQRSQIHPEFTITLISKSADDEDVCIITFSRKFYNYCNFYLNVFNIFIFIYDIDCDKASE